MRLTPLTPDHLTPEQRVLYDAILGGPRGPGHTAEDGHLTGPFNAMLFNPPIGGPLQELGAAIRYQGSLEPVVRELAILTVAAAFRSEVEWHAHSRIARELGVEAEVLDNIRRGVRPVLDGPKLEVLLEVARALLDRTDVDDGLYERASSVAGEGGLVELTTLVGYYGILATQLRLFRVPLPEGTLPVFE